jgi:hypothetical protein
MNSDIALESLAELKRILNAPSKFQIVWESLNRSERSTILRHAGLVGVGCAWCDFCAASQKKIIDSIVKASNWASKLGQSN